MRLNAVHGRSRANGGVVLPNSDIWAVGDAGNILWFNGTNWIPQTVPAAASAWNLNAVFIYPTDINVGADQVTGWAVGDGGTVLRLTHNLGVYAWVCESCPNGDCGPSGGPPPVWHGDTLNLCANLYDIFPSDSNDVTAPIFFTGATQCWNNPDSGWVSCPFKFGAATTLFWFKPGMTKWAETTGNRVACTFTSTPYQVDDNTSMFDYDCSTGPNPSVNYTGYISQLTAGTASAGGLPDTSWKRWSMALTFDSRGFIWNPSMGDLPNIAPPPGCANQPAYYTSTMFGKWAVVMGDSAGCWNHHDPAGAIINTANMFIFNQYSGGIYIIGVNSGLSPALGPTWGTVRKLAALPAWGFGIGVGHGLSTGADVDMDRAGTATNAYFSLLKWTDTNRLVQPQDPSSPNTVSYWQDPAVSVCASKTPWPKLNGVFISAYNEAWAVGDSGKILHWAGPTVTQAKLVAALSLSPSGGLAPGMWVDVVLTVTNTGEAGLANLLVDLIVTPPSGAALVCGPFCSTIWCDVLTSPCPVSLPPGGPAYFTWTYSITGCGTGISFTGSASGTDLLFTQPVFASTAYIIGAPPPSLSVTIWHSPASPSPGDLVSYTIVVTNTSLATVSDLVVVDTIPPGFTVVSTDPPAANVGSTYYWDGTGSKVPPFASLTFTVTGNVPAQCYLSAFGNRAWAVGNDGCGFYVQKASPQTVFSLPALPQPAITVSLTSAPAPVVGMPVVYTILVTNSGTTTITNLLVVDTIPAVLGNPAIWNDPWFVSSSTYSPSGATLSWFGSPPGGLLPGTSWTFSATVTVPSACTGTSASNMAWARAGNGCLSAQAASGAVSFPIPGQVSGALSIVSEAEIPGRYYLTVTLTITDTGASWMNNILPATDLVVSPSSAETIKVGGPYPTAYWGSLAPMGSCTLDNPCAVSFWWNYRSSTTTPITITANAAVQVCPPPACFSPPCGPGYTYSYTGCAAQGGSSCTFSANASTYFSDAGDIGDFSINRNMFRGRTETMTATFQLKETTHVTLEVYNSVGQKVKTLYKGTWPRRMLNERVWDGTNDAGERCASGAYFIRLESAHLVKTKKVALVK